MARSKIIAFLYFWTVLVLKNTSYSENKFWKHMVWFIRSVKPIKQNIVVWTSSFIMLIDVVSWSINESEEMYHDLAAF